MLLFFSDEKSRWVTQSAASHIVRKQQCDSQWAVCRQHCHRTGLIHSCRTLVSQSSRRRAAPRGPMWLTAGEETEKRWMCVILVFELVFPHGYAVYSAHVQYARTHKSRAWMGIINLNYNVFLFPFFRSDWPAAGQLVNIRITRWESQGNTNTKHVFRCILQGRLALLLSSVEASSSTIVIKKQRKRTLIAVCGKSGFCPCLEACVHVCGRFWKNKVGV